ncbi:unnamed protein product [Chironomus riparius]|uniref:Uncharacterized protein n=1 Tax=Chironomus riparius TaxID=315576 RepID=A0A9P0NGP9_9DIPT|nr:unnamed protein product [Chironomus riparius]
MNLINAFIILYLTSYNVNGKGLTMITRGCIANYLKQNQLLNVSLKIGPTPSPSYCNNLVTKVKKTIIESAIKSLLKLPEESVDDITTYKECFRQLINRNNVTDVLLKDFMYNQEEIGNHNEMRLITNEILKLFDYLCYPQWLQDDFNRKFTTSFAGYEKETNRFCLVNLLREKEVIDRDFNVNFKVNDTSSLKCPEYINEDILSLKTEAFDLVYQNELYRNEEIWECAAEERLKIGYVRSYYRLMAYTFFHENDTRKSEERQKFLNVLQSANEVASKCFKIGFEIL